MDGTTSYGLLRDTAGNTLAHIVLMLFSCSRVSRASVASPSGAAAAAAAAHLESSVEERTVAAAAATHTGHIVGSPNGHPGGNGGSGGSGSSGGGRDAGGDSGHERSLGQDDRAKNTSPPSPTLDRTPGWSLQKEEKVEAGGGGGGSEGEGGARGRGDMDEGGRVGPFGRGGAALGRNLEEEPWPSLDSAVEDDAAQGLDDGVVVAGRGALKAMIGGKDGGAVVPSSPVGSRGEEAGEGAPHGGGGESGGEEEEGVLVKVMRFLSLLSDPRSNGREECVLSLSLINIALEAAGADLGRIPALVRVMRGDLCKRLLQNSQTGDLDVLSLTLRVVFNLFNSIKDHLKVQLEVFLTR